MDTSLNELRKVLPSLRNLSDELLKEMKRELNQNDQLGKEYLQLIKQMKSIDSQMIQIVSRKVRQMDPRKITQKRDGETYVQLVVLKDKSKLETLQRLKLRQIRHEKEMYEKYKDDPVRVYKHFQELYLDYHRQFGKLGIPFFCLDKNLYYEGYKDDRRFIVDLIDKLLRTDK